MDVKQLLAVLLLAMSLGAAFAQEAANRAIPKGRVELNDTDRAFLRKAALDGLAELRLAKLASEKAENVEVKQLAFRLIDDHTSANNKLVQLAGVKGVTVPAQLPSGDAAQADRLAGLSGAAFDRAYTEQMIRDHTEAVALYEGEIRNGQDQDIKNFSASTLPLLREHLQEARNIADKRAAGR